MQELEECLAGRMAALIWWYPTYVHSSCTIYWASLGVQVLSHDVLSSSSSYKERCWSSRKNSQLLFRLEDCCEALSVELPEDGDRKSFTRERLS